MLAAWRAVAHLDNPQGEKARLNLEKVPEITPHEACFYRAFWELHTERPMGMAPGYIPRSAIRDMADEEGMGPTDAMIFMRVIRAMDHAYMAAKAAQQQQNTQPK